MMNFLRCLIIATLFCTLFACEKVVQVDVNEYDPKFFIEAYVFDEKGNNLVYVRKTQGVFDDKPDTPISNANVTIEEDGKIYSLTFNNNGYFRNDTLEGKSGSIYKLTVEVEDQTFTATSVMPNKASYDNVLVGLPFPLTEGGDTLSPCLEGDYFIFNQFTDIPNEKNFYLFDYNRFETTGETAQSSTDDQLYLQDDNFNDGIQSCTPFFNTCFLEKDEEGNIQEVKSIMYNITEIMYNYYFVIATIANNGGPGGDVTPQNPDTNIEGGALGFFSTAALTRKTTQIISSPIQEILKCR